MSRALRLKSLKRGLHKKYKIPVLTLGFIFSVVIFFTILFIQSGNLVNNSIKRTQDILSTNELIISNLSKPESDSIKILFVGDIMLARSIGQSIKYGNDPFVNVKNKFKDYDIIVGNLETTIANLNTGYSASKGYNFKAPIESAKNLADSGIDIVSLANNHSMDYGEDALLETIHLLNNNGVGSFGAGKTFTDAYKPFYVKYKNIKIAFIGLNNIERWVTDINDYHGGSAYFDETLVRKSLKDAQDNSDLQIVFPHWGEEYTTLVNADQKKWARFFIDNGADLVVGSHPHVVQTYETYKDKFIYYSLGNFVFDGMKGIYLADKGSMLEVNIVNKEIAGHTEYFVELGWDGFPRLSN